VGVAVIEPVAWEGRCGAVEWAAYATAYPGQMRSGDAFLVEATPTGALLAVVDGLGHGEEAAAAADLAMASLRETAGSPLGDCLMACHGALRGSRGAAVTLVSVDSDHGRLTWIAVGNVEAALVRPGRDGAPAGQWSVPLRGGVVGDRLPTLRESMTGLAAGDTLVVATDGLSPAFVDAVDGSPATTALTRRLHRRYARADDDALVLVARCGAGPNGH
jgi:phosphoserine phosphatase RsbX